jgi:hypothetical protein
MPKRIKDIETIREEKKKGGRIVKLCVASAAFLCALYAVYMQI